MQEKQNHVILHLKNTDDMMTCTDLFAVFVCKSVIMSVLITLVKYVVC